MNAKPEKSRLGELLVDMRLVDEDTLQQALADQRASGVRLATALAQRRVLDEERLTKAVAARLGLEAVSVASHKIHERVLNLVPQPVAKKFGVLPIAIKRTQQAEVLYLVMVDPLNTEALGEVQRITGRQIRVLMATASELDQCIDAQYRELESKLGQASTRPARGAATRPPATPEGTPPPASIRPARRVSVPGLPPRGGSATPRPATSAAPASSRAPAQAPLATASTPPRPAAVGRASGMPQQTRPAPSRPDDLRASRTPAPRPAPASEPFRARTPPPAIKPSTPPPAVKASTPPPVVKTPAPVTKPAAPLSSAPPPAPARPLNLHNPATLIDTARPPEIEGLSEQLGLTSAPVMPSELDPPDAVATRIEADPYGGALEPVPEPVEQPSVDWGGLGGPAWDAPPDMWGALDPSESAPGQKEQTNLDDQWARATGVEPEDIATSQLELSEENQAALLADVGGPEPVDKRTLASTMELPVEIAEEPNPFEGPAPGEIPVGLERTGIFPAVDFESESFEPPDLAMDKLLGQAGSLSDIPDSEAAVRARFGDQGPTEDDDAIEAIEEVMLEPLDDEPLEVVDGPDAPAAPDEPISPAPAPADGEAMPVIEPSSLVSLMDDAENADTGSAEVPVLAKPPEAPPTRLFDEADRAEQPPKPAPASGEAEEPTNPRMEAPSSIPEPPTESSATPSAPGLVASARPTMIDAPAPTFDVLQPAPKTPPPVTLSEAHPPPLPAGPIPPAPMPPAPMTAGPNDEVEASTTDEVAQTEAAVPVAARTPAITQEEPAPEEPTPAQDPVERADVLDALEGAFVPRAGSTVEATAKPREDTPSERRDEAVAMVDRLVGGESLNSAERAQLVLALGRRLVAKGILTRDELVDELASDT